MEAFAIGAAAIIANVLDVSRIISALTLQARKIFPEPAAAVPVGQKKRLPYVPQKSLREKLARFARKFRASLSRKDSGRVETARVLVPPLVPPRRPVPCRPMPCCPLTRGP